MAKPRQAISDFLHVGFHNSPIERPLLGTSILITSHKVSKGNVVALAETLLANLKGNGKFVTGTEVQLILPQQDYTYLMAAIREGEIGEPKPTAVEDILGYRVIYSGPPNRSTWVVSKYDEVLKAKVITGQ